MLPSGLGVWVRYRQGVDSIWTGLGLPSEEIGLEDRLGLPPAHHMLTDNKAAAAEVTTPSSSSSSSKKKEKKEEKESTSKRGGRAAKDLRRAYYRKSLQWHPDRWATMPAIYLPGHIPKHRHTYILSLSHTYVCTSTSFLL